MYDLYMSDEISVSEARAQIGPITDRAEYAGVTTYLTKRNRRAAAVVPAAAAELLEALEEVLDGQAVSAALAAIREGLDAPRPFVRRTPRGEGA